LQERFSRDREFFFQLFCAVAIAASPELGSILVPAVAPSVSVFHLEQVEKFFPIGTLFG